MLRVPTQAADNPTQGGGNKPFPMGSWIGVIEEVRVRNFPDFAADNNSGFGSADGEILSLQIGSATPADGRDESAGNKKLFIDLVWRDGGTELIDANDIPEDMWRLQQSARLATNLATALGQAIVVNGFYEVDPTFFEALQTNSFKGTKIGFEVYHRKTKSKTRPVVEDVKTFFPAV